MEGIKDIGRKTTGVKRMLADSCKKAGVDFVQKIVYGNPGYEIAKFANMSRNKIDMVVIGSRGRSSAKELFFGSTSQFVLHKSKPSVLIIK